MKDIKLSSVLLSLAFFVFQINALAQTGNKAKSWSTDDPFCSDVFVENLGQFDKWVTASSPVKYAINKSDLIFFTQRGVIFKLRKDEPLSEEKREKIERKASKEITSITDFYYITMDWQECNVNAMLEASDQTEGYFTFGEEDYEQVRAKGCKKLTYKSIYPGIDVEYIIPSKGGIKYSIIAHPGADISKVRMHYSGDVDKISIDDKGNIIIKTPAGNITDHTPISYIESTGDTITSSFEVKDNTVSFSTIKLPTLVLSLAEASNIHPSADGQTIIIDPWTTLPSYLMNDYAAYDISYDDLGNTYVSGGTYQFKLAKYDPSGNFTWGYTLPSAWSPNWSCYSRFCLLPVSGTVFIGEAANPNGPRVMKLNSSGTLIYTTPNFYGNEEIWVMFYNRCTGQLAGFGGGTQLANNLQLIADTNLSSSTIKNFNYYSGPRNDIASVEMDYNGDFYALMSSNANACANHIMKSLVALGYNPPTSFDVSSGYDYFETGNSGIPGFTPQNVTTRANALALNSDYLFSYDGATIKAWNKASGGLLASLTISMGYSGGQYRTHEGIAVDDCNRVYAGGNAVVHVYTFNGTSFTAAAAITTNIPREVYDVRINRTTNTLYVAGLGFVTVGPATVCNTGNVLSITDSINNCFGNACVSVSGGTPPYTYHWSTGATTNCIGNLNSGTYTVTVSDNSCIQQHIIDTIVIARDVVVQLSGDTVICVGSSASLSAAGAANYIWSPSTGLSLTSGANVTASPVITTLYTVTGTTNGCPGTDTIRIYVNPRPEAFLGNDTLVCGVPSVTLNADNPGYSYAWSTGESTQTIVVTTSGNYAVTVTGQHCTGADTIAVNFVPPPMVDIGNDTTICPGQTVALDAHNPGAIYQWSTGASSQAITATSAGTYWVIVSIGVCVVADTMLVHMVPNIDLGRDQSLCFQPQDTLGIAGEAQWFQWSTGETTPQIVVSEPGTYWLTVFRDNCLLSDTVKVVGGFISLYMPNAFTPDNNGLNDYFRPYGEGITAFDMKIYDRWGEQLFTSTDMNFGWDGRYQGNKAPLGVYVWVITYKTVCEGNWDLRRYGEVMLVR